jgi:hypothetical protein
MPADKSVWSHYVDGEHVKWRMDSKGQAGILTLHPFHEPGELEEVWEFEKYVDSAIYLRERLISGDLRPLYVLWLCGAYDDYNDPAEVIEPPVPHGIDEMVTHVADLMSFYGLDPLLLISAGENVEAAPSRSSKDDCLSQWLSSLSNKQAKELLRDLLSGDTPSVKAKVLAEIRNSQEIAAWPTTERSRSFAELLQRTDELRAKESAKKIRKAEAKEKREAKKAERERQKRMQEMEKAPKTWLKEAEQLVDARGTENYRAAAEILSDLREAVGGDEGERIARRHAAHLAKKHPTLNHLKSSLRKHGLLN